MKPVKNFVLAALLLSTLAFNTFAGDIDVPGYIPPPPPRMTDTTDDSTIPVTGTETQETVVSDYLLFEALAALLSMY
jgi:hypothetical protein